jgi:hypothetical protein
VKRAVCPRRQVSVDFDLGEWRLHRHGFEHGATSDVHDEEIIE